jgi:hypothetical protein
MKKFLSTLCATALAASFGLTGAIEASAAPVYVPKVQTLDASNVIEVNDHWKKRRYSRGDRGRKYNRQFRGDGRYGWHNGHRGYRHKRYRSDRYYDGFWFPAGAFVAGAIIGGAIANNNNYVYRDGGNAHERWCYDRYRSYRAWDNTFQPYNGPRRLCYSPYS